MNSTIPIIPISPRAARQLRSGYLWIFSNEFQTKITGFSPGTSCFFSCEGKVVATGYVNPHSLIAGRVLCLYETSDVESVLRQHLKNAFERRKSWQAAKSLRLVFSEADFLPGLILDWYSGILVLQSNTAGIDFLLPALKNLIPVVFAEVFKEKISGFVVRGDSSIRTLEGLKEFSEIVMGEATDLEKASFQEFDVTYAANFLQGQKTGFFLDQRDNRLAMGQVVRTESTVLDLFCYSGGWGLKALSSGAKHVTFVDQSHDALEHVRRGLELAPFSSDRTTLVEKDVFDFLAADTKLYDVVVSDPPAFVKSKKVLPQAKRAYEKLNSLVWRRLKRGGTLFTCSCSYHLSDADFWDVLSNAISKEEGLAHVVYRGGQALDHPILLSMPETNYLKCVGIKKL